MPLCFFVSCNLLLFILLCSQTSTSSKASGENYHDVVVFPHSIDISPLLKSISSSSLSFSSLSSKESSDYTLQLQVAYRIDSALQEFGFFLIHGEELHTIHRNGLLFEESIEAAAELFSLPLEEKLSVGMKSLGTLGRGYLEMGRESGVKDDYMEIKEGYSYGLNSPALNHTTGTYHPLQLPNVWPSSLSSRAIEALETVFTTQIQIAKVVTYALQLVADHEADESRGKEDGEGGGGGEKEAIDYMSSIEGGDTISLMRLFHYFPVNSSQSKENLKEIIGSSPHTDWGFLTVIHQNNVPGLQFYINNRWTDVLPSPRSLLINGGDFLHLLSEGRYMSPVHRVISPMETHRYSFVLFFYPNHNTRIPLENDLNRDLKEDKVDRRLNFSYNTLLVSKDGDEVSSAAEKKHEMSFGDYIMEKWKGVLNN